MTSHSHSMPFGTDVRADGTVRFGIWAPGQDRLSLVLEDGGGRVLPMERRADDGYFVLETDAARAGSRYRFELTDGMRVPDPISRYQPEDVHGPSVVVDPRAYTWRHGDWRGRPWHETVLYELHTGAFSAEGTYDGIRRKLDHLAKLGVTAVELMPVAEFPGTRNWGYDGVLLFAPDAAYGTPDDLKRLIDEIHGRGMMAFLDVVYNHFGPEGNYLSLYAPGYFDQDTHTPWGAAVNYAARHVRDVVVNNVLYWLQEYRFDGLRFDAVDQIIDTGDKHILVEVAETVRRTIDPAERHVHLVLENDRNQASLLERKDDGLPRYYDAQWCDDIHHSYQHLVTGDTGGYYRDYAEHGVEKFARGLKEGFIYQNDVSEYRGGERRGEPSAHLPPVAFVAFMQNHDQVGNRAFGERIADMAPWHAVRAMAAIQLLAPQVPLLFMGEEWGATQPFCYFTDFHDELADAVREGRRREFKKFPEFADEASRGRIPDPNAPSTFEASRLDWSVPERDEEHAAWLHYYRGLLDLRHREVVPRLSGVGGHAAEGGVFDQTGLRISWTLGDGSRLTLLANIGEEHAAHGAEAPAGELLFETADGLGATLQGGGTVPPWSAAWFLQRAA